MNISIIRKAAPDFLIFSVRFGAKNGKKSSEMSGNLNNERIEDALDGEKSRENRKYSRTDESCLFV